jgi:hypothetical protein
MNSNLVKSKIDESTKEFSNRKNNGDQFLNEIKEREITPTKKKFIVTKLFQELSISPKSLFDEAELLKQKTKTQHEYSKSCILLSDNDDQELNNLNGEIDATSLFNSNNNNNNNINDVDLIREIEDDFNENEVLDSDKNGLNVNGNRYAEGQDTITSLKNSIFVKKLTEIRNKRNNGKTTPTGSIQNSQQSINSDHSNISLSQITNDIPPTPQSKRALLLRSDSSTSTLSSRKQLPIIS